MKGRDSLSIFTSALRTVMEIGFGNGIIRPFRVPINLNDVPATCAVEQLTRDDAASVRFCIVRAKTRFVRGIGLRHNAESLDVVCNIPVEEAANGCCGVRVTGVSVGGEEEYIRNTIRTRRKANCNAYIGHKEGAQWIAVQISACRSRNRGKERTYRVFNGIDIGGVCSGPLGMLQERRLRPWRWSL